MKCLWLNEECKFDKLLELVSLSEKIELFCEKCYLSECEDAPVVQLDER